MPNEKDAVSEFLDGLDKPQADPFKSENDPFAPKAEETVVEEVEEKPLPFHKDPKVQRYVEKEIAKALKDVKPSEVQTFTKETEDEISDVLVRIIGNDTPEKQAAVKDFRKVLGGLEERGAQKALQEFKAQADAKVEEDRKAQAELDESFDEIEETFNVDLSSNAPSARKTRSEFVEFVQKIAPKNAGGEVTAFPDMNSAWEEFQERSKRQVPSNSKAKELASRSMSRSTDATAIPQNKGTSWKEVEKIFSKLN